jgi:aryl-alcohol dehydrogenase-like predicted oxidoreductase
LAKTLGMPVHHLALLWCLANPNVSTVILGASKKSQLNDNLSALKDKGKLTPDVLAEIDAMLGNKPPAPERY